MDKTKIFESQPWLNDSLQNRRGITRIASMGTKEKNMIVTMSIVEDFLTLSATWQEIADAMREGKNVVVVDVIDGTLYGVYPVLCVVYDPASASNKYSVKTELNNGELFTCATASGYPAFEL